jgi:hypothetical protein
MLVVGHTLGWITTWSAFDGAPMASGLSDSGLVCQRTSASPSSLSFSLSHTHTHTLCVVSRQRM